VVVLCSLRLRRENLEGCICDVRGFGSGFNRRVNRRVRRVDVGLPLNPLRSAVLAVLASGASSSSIRLIKRLMVTTKDRRLLAIPRHPIGRRIWTG
jgi:hypothetical protein